MNENDRKTTDHQPWRPMILYTQSSSPPFLVCGSNTSISRMRCLIRCVTPLEQINSTLSFLGLLIPLALSVSFSPPAAAACVALTWFLLFDLARISAEALSRDAMSLRSSYLDSCRQGSTRISVWQLRRGGSIKTSFQCLSVLQLFCPSNVRSSNRIPS